MALTLARLRLPQVDLGAVALGILEDTSDSALEDAEDAVAPLVPPPRTSSMTGRCWPMSTRMRKKRLLLPRLPRDMRKNLVVKSVAMILGVPPFKQRCTGSTPVH